MLWASPYEALIIVLVFLAVTAGPVVAGMLLAWARRKRAALRGKPPSE